MNEKQRTATIAVMTDIRALESARMESLRSAAQLVVTMTEAHRHAGMQFHEGQPELVAACKIVADEGERNLPVAKLHRHLAVFAAQRGFDWRMAGDAGATNWEEALCESGAEAGAPVLSAADTG